MTKQTANVRIGIIMAGGFGERFWPLSRWDRPKQLLRLTNPDQSMLEEAVARIAPLISPEQTYVATGEHLVEPIRQAKVGVPDENVIAEPCKRNTSGALAYAAAHALAAHGGDGTRLTMAVTTADHRIGDAKRFRKTIGVAMDTAEQEQTLVTLGVTPSRPETGYGYIQAREEMRECSDLNNIQVCAVSAFHEKPRRERAEDFVASGRYFWNSGMFFWTIATFLKELDEVRPQLARATRDMAEAMRANNPNRVRKIFEKLEDISIDYALMERAKRVMVVRADFPWDDVGAWPALDRSHTPDAEGNILVGEPVVIESEDCIVYNEAGPDDMAVAVVGVEDLVVVVTRDAVLVVPKNRAQDTRHVVKELKRRNARQV